MYICTSIFTIYLLLSNYTVLPNCFAFFTGFRYLQLEKFITAKIPFDDRLKHLSHYLDTYLHIIFYCTQSWTFQHIPLIQGTFLLTPLTTQMILPTKPWKNNCVFYDIILYGRMKQLDVHTPFSRFICIKMFITFILHV